MIREKIEKLIFNYKRDKVWKKVKKHFNLKGDTTEEIISSFIEYLDDSEYMKEVKEYSKGDCTQCTQYSCSSITLKRKCNKNHKEFMKEKNNCKYWEFEHRLPSIGNMISPSFDPPMGYFTE